MTGRETFEGCKVTMRMLPGQQGTHLSLINGKGKLQAECIVRFSDDTLMWLYVCNTFLDWRK